MTRLRERADNMAATAAALKKIADAADPLYKTLDDGQKRRLAVLTHHGGRFGGGGGWRHRFEHGMMGGDRDCGRTDRSRDHGDRGGSEPALAARSPSSPGTAGKPPDSGGFFDI